MIKKIKISEDVELVFSFDDCGYDDIVSDFNKANIIKIVTFNISSESSNLLNKIKSLDATTNVEIITNIPNRYATYYSNSARERARKNIESYTKQLNPKEFNPLLSSYFNFSNHSKIILTNNIAYIGSANASDESSNNFESGVIIRNKKVIDEIINSVIPMIREESVEYYGDDISRIIILLLNLLLKIKKVKEEFHFSFYKINDHRGADIEYYDSFNSDLSPITLENIESVLYEYDDIVNSLDDYDDIDDFEKKDISEVIELTNELIEFANYDIEAKTCEYLQEYSYCAYDEELDEYADIAFQRAADEKTDLGNDSRDTVEQVDSELQEIIDSITSLYESVEGMLKVNDKIDNT